MTAQQPQKIEDVRFFAAWVNTLTCDCGNLYRLAKIYERDHKKIKKESEVLRYMKYLDEVKL
jgi:hypothetical protein